MERNYNSSIVFNINSMTSFILIKLNPFSRTFFGGFIALIRGSLGNRKLILVVIIRERVKVSFIFNSIRVSNKVQ